MARSCSCCELLLHSQDQGNSQAWGRRNFEALTTHEQTNRHHQVHMYESASNACIIQFCILDMVASASLFMSSVLHSFANSLQPRLILFIFENQCHFSRVLLLNHLHHHSESHQCKEVDVLAFFASFIDFDQIYSWFLLIILHYFRIFLTFLSVLWSQYCSNPLLKCLVEKNYINIIHYLHWQ